jgi:hypothetical protein
MHRRRANGSHVRRGRIQVKGLLITDQARLNLLREMRQHVQQRVRGRLAQAAVADA